MIKNPNYGKKGAGSVEREVPWRENTKIRTARRSDLIRLLTVTAKFPHIEILKTNFKHQVSISEANTDSNTRQQSSDNSYENKLSDELIFNADLYFIPTSPQRVIIPFHQCTVTFRFPGEDIFQVSNFVLKPAPGLSWGMRSYPRNIPGSVTAQRTAHELILDGPSRIILSTGMDKPDSLNLDQGDNVKIKVCLKIANSENTFILEKSSEYLGEEKIFI